MMAREWLQMMSNVMPLKRVETGKATAVEQQIEAEQKLEEAQKNVLSCRTLVDSLTPEMLSLQMRLDQAMIELPVTQPQGDQLQTCMASSMALANAAAASACISPHE